MVVRFLTDMETELPQMQMKNKEPNRRAAAPKKPLSTADDDHDDIEIIDDDDDFEPEEKKKKGGRKPAANGKAAKPPAGAKKRGPASSKQSQLLGQKLITEVLKPADNSPEKKVRKMRASPFNKKSSSVLGRTVSIEEEDEEETSEMSLSTLGSATDVSQAVAPAARPKRANRGKATYIISDDSESDHADDFVDSDATEDDSDFNDDED